jgi:peptidoglycan LD-endopeptidase CwlK
MTFRPSARTERNLIGVHPDLVAGVRLAYQLSTVDFGILDGGGLRTREQAAANAAKGTGILNSLHLRQPDGFGHAVDLVAFVNGKPSWDVEVYKRLHPFIYEAFDRLGTPIQNGADWDMDGKVAEKGEYDWPHWQLPQPYKRDAAIAAGMRRQREREMQGA